MNIKVEHFTNIDFITIDKDNGFSITLSSLGAAIYFIKYNYEYMNLCHKDYRDFILPNQYHGKTIGRVSNRIKGNKIKVDNKYYVLENNENDNTLHGGKNGISSKVFSYTIKEKKYYSDIVFQYLSEDHDAGFPGNLLIIVIYRIFKYKDNFRIEYKAQTDKKTPCSLTNHTYFTLGEESIENLKIKINSDHYLDVDPHTLLSTRIKKVNKVMDFQSFKKFSKYLSSPSLKNTACKGYDHFYYFKNINPRLNQIILQSPKYCLSIKTDFEGSQVYTDNYPSKYVFYNTNFDKNRAVALEPSDTHKKLHLISKNQTYNRFILFSFKKIN